MSRPEWHVVSLSGGKDSTALLLMMLERGMRVDEVVFCDTGVEFPEMYEHLDRVEAYTGRKITRLSGAPYTFEYYAFEHRRVKGKYSDVKGYGWARPRTRWCTAHLKTRVIGRHFKELSKTHELVEYVGIAADESHRCKDKRYPLVDWGVTEAEALAYCYERGFDWGGAYERFDRFSCWCCPLQGLKSLRALRKHYPDLWEKLREYDRRAWNSFKIGCTVEQLEERFACEDRQMTLEFEEAPCE